MLASLTDLFTQHGPFVAVLFGTGFTFLMTVLGAGFVFFLGKTHNPRMQSITLGFAAGIMIAASVWSLLIPAIEMSQKSGGSGWAVAAGGFILGGLFLALLDKILPHLHAAETEPEGPKTKLGKSTLLVLAVTLHNIPEGMSVGLAFAMASLSGEPAALSAAFALALGMGLQNIPEGTAVALPLHECGWTKTRAFAAGSLSGLVEPVFGLLTVLALPLIAPHLPLFLAFAAGAMMYVVVEELIPTAHENAHSDMGTLSVLGGFLLMMVLDVALG